MPSRFEERFQALAVPRIVREFGVDVSYTKSGEAQSNAITLVIQPRESRLVENNGFMFEVFRVHASGETDEYDPNQGDRLVYGSKTWDYAGLSREAVGGMAHAYFESMDLKHIGVAGSPV